MATNDAPRWFTKTRKRVGQLVEEAFVLKSQFSKLDRVLETEAQGSERRSREIEAVGARVSMLCDELCSPKRRQSMNCELEVTTHKVADVQGDTTNLVKGPHRSTVSSYGSISRNDDGVLGKVNTHFMEAFD